MTALHLLYLKKKKQFVTMALSFVAPRGIADFSVIPHVKSLLVKPGEFCSKKYPSRPLTYTVLYREKTGDNITSCEEGSHHLINIKLQVIL